MKKAKQIKTLLMLCTALIVMLLCCKLADAQPASVVWVNVEYCEGCSNDGHTWGYDAFTTIQEGIDNAASPGTVQVAAGTYVENVSMKSGVNVLGAGPDLTIVDGGGTSTVLTFGWLDQETAIEGFTIQNGRSSGFSGAGVSIIYSQAVIRNNSIKNCQGWGIGILSESSPTIQQNTITQNDGGILILGSTPAVIGNVIKRNRGCGIETMNTNIFTVVNNLICENESDGVKYAIPYGSSDVKIVNNTISGNVGSGINGNRDPGLKVLNNIIEGSGNCGITFDSSYDWGTPNSDYNNVWNNAETDYCGLAVVGANDLSEDPLFRNAPGGDYHLWPFSPCVDAGTLSGSPIADFEGDPRPVDGNKDGLAAVDLGADETGILFDHDITTYSTMPNPVFLQLGRAFVPKVKVLNVGTLDESNVPISCDIKRNNTMVFSYQKSLPQLLSKAAEEVAFSQWVAQETGEHELKFYSQLAGDENSANDTQVRIVRVVLLEAKYSYQLKQGGLSLEVQFTDHSTGEIAQWYWDFGDNTTSTERNPTHVYSEPGRYTVTLTVSKGDASDMQTQTVVLPDIFGMEPGNLWTFRGMEQGIPFNSEQEIVPVPQETYDATGVWSYSLTSGWVDPGNAGCGAVQDHAGTAYVTQLGEIVTLSIEGVPYAGYVSGTMYFMYISYPFQGGTVTEYLDFGLESATSGSGSLQWEWTDGVYWCQGGNVLTMTRPNTQTGLPANLFIQEERKDGIVEGTSWYERSTGQVKYWGFQAFEEGMPYNFRFSEGLLVAWYPMVVGDHKESSADVVGFPGLRVSMVVDVLALEDLSLSFGTFKAYKLRFQFRTYNGSGTDETETFYQWMAPYLGVIKSEDDISVDELTSFAIGGGTVDLESDADGDNLKDYQELIVYGTNWQNGDTDGDGCGDGAEVLGGRDPKAADPQGDLNKDCAMDLQDVIAGLQLLNASQVPSIASAEGDVNGNGKIGMEEVLYVLQRLGGMR